MSYDLHWKEVHIHPEGYSPHPRHGHKAVAIKEAIFIFGGGDFKCFNECCVYKPETNRWYAFKTSGQIPSPRASFGLDTDGKHIFLFGGTNGKVVFGDLYVLNLEKLEWTCTDVTCEKSTDKPRARFGCSFNYLDGGFFLFGGIYTNPKSNKESYLDDLFVLKHNESTYCWKKIETEGELPTARESHTTVTFKANEDTSKLLVYGGTDQNGFCLPDIYLFDIATSTWKKPEVDGRPPYPRSMHTSTVINDKMFVFGGWTPQECNITATKDDQLLVHQAEDFISSNTLAVLDLSSVDTPKENLEWEYVTENVIVTDDKYPRVRANHCAVYLNHRLYIWSGRTGKLYQEVSLHCLPDLWYLELEKPDVPTNLKLTGLDSQDFEVTWDFVGNAQYYHVQILLPNSNKFKPLLSTATETVETSGDRDTQSKINNAFNENETMEVDQINISDHKQSKTMPSTLISEVTKKLKGTSLKGITQGNADNIISTTNRNNKPRSDDFKREATLNSPTSLHQRLGNEKNSFDEINLSSNEDIIARNVDISQPSTKGNRMTFVNQSETKYKSRPSMTDTSSSTKQNNTQLPSNQTKATKAIRINDSCKVVIPQTDGPSDDIESCPTYCDFLSLLQARRMEPSQSQEEKHFEETLAKEKIYAKSRRLYSDVYSNLWYDVGYFKTNRAFITYFLRTDRDGSELVYPFEGKALPPGMYGRHMQAIEEETIYNLRVASVNSHGRSDWSKIFTNIKTNNSKLPLAVENIKLKYISGKGILIEWKQSAEEKSQIIDYIVHIPFQAPYVNNNKEVSLKLYNGSNTECLLPMKLFERLPRTQDNTLREEIIVRVSARNIHGYGPYRQFNFQAPASTNEII